MQNDFFIGWSTETPKSYAKTSKKFIWLLIPLILLIGTLWVHSQKVFSASVFEFGNTTTIEGTLIKAPFPMLRLHHGIDVHGQPVLQHILLVAFGKFGAENSMAAIEENIGEDLENQSIRLNGTLIYYDGKALFELLDGVEAYEGKAEKTARIKHIATKTETSLTGEIIDPKCFFGVMKPGEGKIHKSCAARCISGGIPPIFRTQNGGINDYYLIVGQNGEKINPDLLPFVADHLKLEGAISTFFDWKILYLSTADICSIGPKWIFQDMPICSIEE